MTEPQARSRRTPSMAVDITALYCCLDDFCKVFADWEAHRLLPSEQTRQRSGKLWECREIGGVRRGRYDRPGRFRLGDRGWAWCCSWSKRADGGTRSVALMALGRAGTLRDIAELGLTLPEAKQLLACVQQAVVAVQARDHATLRPDCASCGERFRIKDWRSRRVATLFGEVVVRLPRFRCPGCGRGETGTNWPV